MITVDQAEKLARHFHAGQLYAGEDYADRHLADVVRRTIEMTDIEEVIACAWLHDALEDTALTPLKFLSLGGSMNQLAYVLRCSKLDGQKETRKEFIWRAAGLHGSCVIKLADGQSNYAQCILEGNPSRAEYYAKGIRVLEAALPRLEKVYVK